METIRKVISKFLAAFAGISLGVMTILVVWQVFTRYILKDPATWTEELVAYLFAWSSILGASLVFGERGHMNIPIVAQKFGERGQIILGILGEILIFIFSLTVLIYGGSKITHLAMGQSTSSLGVQVGVFYGIMPVSGILNMIYAILNIIDIAKGRLNPFPEE